MIKAQPSLFVFNRNSHLEGIMHYNKTLNKQWKFNDINLLDEEDEELDEDYVELENFGDDESDDEGDEEFDFDFSEEE